MSLIQQASTAAFFAVPLILASHAAAQSGPIAPIPGGQFQLFTTPALTTPGLIGHYVNSSLRTRVVQDDWTLASDVTIAGTRTDPAINFTTNDWGNRADLHLTGGSNSDWDNFSVQWDGYVQILTPGMRLVTISDDSSRMWIDINGDGVFGSIAPEFLDNHWGTPQAATRGDLSAPLAPGVYRIRIQYQEDGGGNTIQLFSPGPPTLRVGYVIPSNRSPQAAAVPHIQSIVQLMHSWCCEQMDRYGFGARSFRYETQADGETPLVHVINVSQTDGFLRQDVWSNTINAAQAAGAPIWADGQVWLLFPECHLQQSDGSIIGGVSLGAGYGSGSGGGVAMIGSEKLALDPLTALWDNSTYAGRVIPGIGPYPLVNAVSFPGFENSTISSIESSMIGAAMHETGHAFGAAHDTRNDANFHGNLMYNGLRGIRGALNPDLYPQDDTDLSYAAGLELSVCQFIAPCDGSPASSQSLEATAPAVSAVTTGPVTTVGGQVTIAFHAQDAGGLALALLRLDGNTIAERLLSGSSGDWVLSTPFFTPGQANNYSLAVFDRSGNQTGVNTSITPAPGPNRAPLPYFQVTRSQSRIGDDMRFSASGTSDPDGAPSALRYEWDLNGDGIFDTPSLSSPVYTFRCTAPGTRLVRLRATDAAGASAVSTAIAARIDTCAADIDDGSGTGTPDGGVTIEDLLYYLALFAQGDVRADVDDGTGTGAHDGGVTIEDLLYYLARFVAGC